MACRPHRRIGVGAIRLGERRASAGARGAACRRSATAGCGCAAIAGRGCAAIADCGRGAAVSTDGRPRRHTRVDRAATISQVPPSGPPINLESGKGTLLRLTAPAATVFIANPDIADVQVKSPSLIYVSAKSPGDTVIYAVDAGDNVLLNSPVRVEHDLSRVRDSMHALMPGENIAVSSVENSLVLSGDVSTAGRAEKARALAASVANATDIKGAVVVNQLAVNTPNQVNLRVKIAEVNRTALKALGFNWSDARQNCSVAGRTLGGIACGNITNFLATVGNPRHQPGDRQSRTRSPTASRSPAAARDSRRSSTRWRRKT